MAMVQQGRRSERPVEAYGLVQSRTDSSRERTDCARTGFIHFQGFKCRVAIVESVERSPLRRSLHDDTAITSNLPWNTARKAGREPSRSGTIAAL